MDQLSLQGGPAHQLHWWVYVILGVCLFSVALLLNYILKKINEARYDERLSRLENKATTSQSTQMQNTVPAEVHGRPVNPQMARENVEKIDTTLKDTLLTAAVVSKEHFQVSAMNDVIKELATNNVAKESPIIADEDTPIPIDTDSATVSIINETHFNVNDEEIKKPAFLGSIYKDLHSLSKKDINNDNLDKEITDNGTVKTNETKTADSLQESEPINKENKLCEDLPNIEYVTEVAKITDVAGKSGYSSILDNPIPCNSNAPVPHQPDVVACVTLTESPVIWTKNVCSKTGIFTKSDIPVNSLITSDKTAFNESAMPKSISSTKIIVPILNNSKSNILDNNNGSPIEFRIQTDSGTTSKEPDVLAKAVTEADVPKLALDLINPDVQAMDDSNVPGEVSPTGTLIFTDLDVKRSAGFGKLDEQVKERLETNVLQKNTASNKSMNSGLIHSISMRSARSDSLTESDPTIKTDFFESCTQSLSDYDSGLLNMPSKSTVSTKSNNPPQSEKPEIPNELDTTVEVSEKKTNNENVI